LDYRLVAGNWFYLFDDDGFDSISNKDVYIILDYNNKPSVYAFFG
jgi:hypothetical protein